MGLRSDLKRRALGLSQQAMERLMADERRATRIANAVGKVQRGTQALRQRQDDLMRTLNLASKGDLKALGKQLSTLKRRVRELEEKLDARLKKKAAQGH